MSIQFTKEQHSHTLNNSAEAPPGPPRHSSEVRDGAIRFWRYLGNLGNNNNNDKEMTAKKQWNACYDEKDCGFRSHHVPDARDREKGRMKLQSGTTESPWSRQCGVFGVCGSCGGGVPLSPRATGEVNLER